jgi:hypothetical protein
MRDTEIDSLSPKKVCLKKMMALLLALLCIPISARQERPCGVSACSNSAHYCAIFNHSFNTKSLSFGVSFKFSVNDQVLGAIFTRLSWSFENRCSAHLSISHVNSRVLLPIVAHLRHLVKVVASGN